MTGVLKAEPSLTSLLASRARQQPDDLAYVFLRDGEPAARLTYAQLDHRARLIASSIRSKRPSGPALLLYPTGLEFVEAFFACLYAGVPAVPLPPPRRNRPDMRIATVGPGLPAIARVSTTARVLSDAGHRFAQQPEAKSLFWLATDELTGDAVDADGPFPAKGDDLAYLQYTSGSTSNPKGVMVAHANLMHTLEDLDRGWRHGPESVMVTWLPLFHDMGLIYGMLQPLHGGFPCYMLDPAAFLQRPACWLEAISAYGGTTARRPNFAFGLCTRSVTESEKAALELRSWCTALNAAEPVREDTIRPSPPPSGLVVSIHSPFVLATASRKVRSK